VAAVADDRLRYWEDDYDEFPAHLSTPAGVLALVIDGTPVYTYVPD
jgi:hypothetical protein